MSLAGRVALVTGGSRGLGKAMVLALAEAGADVIVAARRLGPCQVTADLVEQSTGRRALAHSCDVGSWEDVEGLVDAAYDTFGAVDVLVNNAGMSPTYPNLGEVSERLYDKVFGVNLKGPFRLSALIGQRMKSAGRGSIINISSNASIRPRHEYLPYAMAKAGVNAMTVGLAQAYGPEVRVNCIVPGSFRTDMAANWTDEIVAQATGSTALRRLGEPDEIVGTALYFASDASSYTTAAVLTVDGGLA